MARSPSSTVSGSLGPTSSSRNVRTASSGSPSSRRPRNRTSSSVASSAQCTSSRSSTVGPSASRARISRNSRGRVDPVVSSMRSASSGSASMTGPSGAGVATLSQNPRRTATSAPTLVASSPMSEDLPTPASPPSSTSRPERVSALGTHSSSGARKGSRSTSTSPIVVGSPRLPPSIGPSCRAASRPAGRPDRESRATGLVALNGVIAATFWRVDGSRAADLTDRG